MGLTHFIGFSAESYAYRSGAELLANQLAFMKADLAAVDRGVTPWVVALVHKDWNMEAEAYAAFYPVLDAGNVDVLFCGHVSILLFLNPLSFWPLCRWCYCFSSFSLAFIIFIFTNTTTTTFHFFLE